LKLTEDQIAKVLADDSVVSQLWSLVEGLAVEVSTGQFPADLDDWECRLAETMYNIIKEESQ